jgi:CubicO group peptidase (beta-lactamase class C family)
MNEMLKAELAEIVGSTMERLEVPGVSVGIIEGGETYAAAFGVTSVDNPLPVTPETLFQIGSTSKTITATAIMRLVERGEIDLDAAVRKYLPDFAVQSEEDSARVRVIDCLSHVGGWVGDYFRETGNGDDAIARIVEKMRNSPQLTRVGEVFAYNNAAFYVAGRILEVAFQKPFETAVRELVFEPLGLRRTFYCHDDLLSYRVAIGHLVTVDGPKVTRPWRLSCSAAPAGGVVSNIHDQLAYARFHLGDGRAADGTRVLEQETLDRMQRQVVAAGSMCDGVGISWLLRDVGGHHLVQHGGATNGQMSAFVMVPGQDFAFTVLTNANTGSELHTVVGNWILEHVAGISEPWPEEVTPEQPFAEFAAEYANPVGGGVRITADEAGLVLEALPAVGNALSDGSVTPKPPPPMRMQFYGDDKVIVVDPPSRGAHADFLRGPDGAIAWFRFGGRLYRRQ